MRTKLTSVLLLASFIYSCSKPSDDVYLLATPIDTTAVPTGIPLTPPPTIPITYPPGNGFRGDILVDASRDGGVWWFPQYGTYSATLPHQGKALADYLRSLGFTVTVLPRGASVTWELLKKHKAIIRAGNFGDYTTQELSAYDSFLQSSSSLLLLSDHLQYSSNDKLSAKLGLVFTGSYTGTLMPYSNHEINTGVNSLPYIAGSIIQQPDPGKITILGHVGVNNLETRYAAMGIVHHPTARIFFIGDVNGIEGVPQPFTSNLVKWLFN